MITQNDLIDRYVKEVRNKVTNFDWKVQTSALLFNFFKSKGYQFLFIPTLEVKGSKKSLKTPDFLARKKEKVG